MSNRVINFSPGPGTLPLPALEQAQRELLDYEGTGISIMEHSHRGKAYGAVHAETKALLRDLLKIPDNYQILFMQGGARGQFALVPMNLLSKGARADYITTGTWSEKALEEAKLLGNAREILSTKNREGKYDRVPQSEEIEADPSAAYVHLTSNNTIYGTQYHRFPTTEAPLVVDMSSDICWRSIDVSKFGLIYAGAQKNLGPAGVTLVIVRQDLVERSSQTIPNIFRYSAVAKGDSLQNTPPTFAIYMVRNVLKWIQSGGGLAAMEVRNREKADLLYRAIDARVDFYRCPVEPASRSTMNVTFRLPTPELEGAFIQEAEGQRMVGLKGHRSVGGVRVSLYNAIEPAHVQQLVEFMDDFARRHA